MKSLDDGSRSYPSFKSCVKAWKDALFTGLESKSINPEEIEKVKLSKAFLKRDYDEYYEEGKTPMNRMLSYDRWRHAIKGLLADKDTQN